ncbi:MAG: branched-chain amino acid aminotransferase, partial [Solirubrobacteraceae bacterium]|nr:branched-chain amino acid aminotransferase [Solirubrobacteraceae bacterium]
QEIPPYPPTVRLAPVTYAPTRILDGVKTLSYGANMLAARLAQEQGADDALLVTPHGRVLEAPTSTFFWAAGGSLRTPPLDDHILDSITRRVLVEELEVSQEPCPLDDLAHAEEAFLASTIREVQAIAAVDDRELPTDGPLTARAAERFRARVRAALEPVG